MHIRAFFLKAVLPSLVVSLFYLFSHLLGHTLGIQFELFSEKPGTVSVHHTIRGDRFSGKDVIVVKAHPNRWRSVRFNVFSLASTKAIRVGLAPGSDRVKIRNFRFINERQNRLLNLTDELARTASHDLTATSVDAEEVLLIANGNDPYLTLPVAKDFFSYTWNKILAHVFTGFLLCLILFTTIHFWFEFRKSTTSGEPGASRSQGGRLSAAVAICLILTGLSAYRISTTPIRGDATENLGIAFNLHKNNTFSHLVEEHPSPTNFREPIPPLITAIYLTMLDGYFGDFEYHDLLEGRLTYWVKLVNLFWIFWGLLAVFLVAEKASKSPSVGWTSMLLSYVLFFNCPSWIDTLYTELPAATLLAWVAYLSMLSITRKSSAVKALLGLTVGLLILTKGIFLYAFALILPVLVFLVMRPRTHARERLLGVAVIAIACVVSLAPWAWRNYTVLGSPTVSTMRGGGVIYYRSMLNEMNGDEVKGTYYLSGPYLYRLIADRVGLGPVRGDLDLGGRWARLNIGPSRFQTSDREARLGGHPEVVISFHQKASAVFVNKINKYKEINEKSPELMADKEMGREGMHSILTHLDRHLMMTLPFFWQGFWSFAHDAGYPFITNRAVLENAINFINAIAGASVVYIFIIGARRKNWSQLLIATPIITTWFFYTMASQNLPRFFAPTHPLMLVALALLIHRVFGAGILFLERSNAQYKS